MKYVTANNLHVAIIMDGNGRWAIARGLSRTDGHRAGASAVQRTIEAALESGINTLTLYAFSADNWSRPTLEVAALMKLLRLYLVREAHRCIKHGIRLSVIGRRDRLPGTVRKAMETAEAMTQHNRNLHVRLAIDYSARDAILAAAHNACGAFLSRKEFSQLLNHESPAPDVDLLIRTSGEQRLSDFLLWECAYAELYFTKVFWPDFGRQDLLVAINAFHARDRRFGGLQMVDVA